VINAPPYGKGKIQLFNVADDPGETRDLAQEYPGKLNRARHAWRKYAEEVGVVSPD